MYEQYNCRYGFKKCKRDFEMKENQFKDVIIFSFLGLGDFVWETSAISLIKQYDKNIKVTLITFDSFFKLVSSDLKIDDSILISNKLFNYKYKIVRYGYKFFWFTKTFFKLYKRETIIFLDISKALGFASKYIYKIKNIIGPSNLNYGYNIKNNSSMFYTKIINLPTDRDRLHCMIAYQIMIRQIFPTYNLSLPILKNTDSLLDTIKEKFLKNTKEYKVAICLSGNGTNRYWNIDSFVELIDKINNLKEESIFFIIGSGSQQQDKAKKLILKSQSNNILNLINKTTMLEVMELLKNMDLFISVDTGLVHMASVYNKNIICLYGQSLPERSGAVNPNAISLCTYEKCSPCNDGKQVNIEICEYKCMQNITVEMVLDKVKEILHEKK